MDPILIEATQERERVEKSIDELRGRLAEIESFIHTYQELSARVSGRLVQTQDRVNIGTLLKAKASVTELPRRLTIKEMVVAKCEHLLGDGRPRPTRELVDALTIMGVPLQAQDKLLQVSKILSTTPKFVADRARGWTLASATKSEGPDAGTSEPSVSNEAPNPRPQGDNPKRQKETS